MNLTTVNHNCAYYHTVGLTQFSITETHAIQPKICQSAWLTIYMYYIFFIHQEIAKLLQRVI